MYTVFTAAEEGFSLDSRTNTPGELPWITQDDIFRPGEHIHVNISYQYPDFIGVIHKHTFIELAYILSGSAIHVVGDVQIPAEKGDLFIINYDTPHAFFPQGDTPLIAYDVLFTPDFLDPSLLSSVHLESIHSSFLFNTLSPSAQFGPDIHISGSSYTLWGELLNKIYLEYIHRENGYEALLRAYLVELIVNIFRNTNDTAPAEQSTPQSRIVETTLTFLKKNYQKHLSLDDLAAQVFLSKDYFSRVFRENTGMSVSAFLQKLRIEEACKLLTTTNYTVDQIASLCGFGDVKHFYTTFKKRTGTTPRQYRLQQTSKNE